MSSLNSQVKDALTASYQVDPDDDMPALQDDFGPSTKVCDFELVLHEMERRGWVYEHTSTIINGLRGHSFWIGEHEEAESEVTATLAGEDERLSPTRLLAGCRAFLEAVETEDGEEKAHPQAHRKG